MDGIKV